jgi:hypothetical protein
MHAALETQHEGFDGPQREYKHDSGIIYDDVRTVSLPKCQH